MSIILTYPIKATNKNLALKKEQSVVAYYRIPNTPITITDEYKKEKIVNNIFFILPTSYLYIFYFIS